MKKTDKYFHRLAITKPFASGVDAILTPIANTAGEDSSVNFNDGFPAAYSAPKSNKGKYITRGEMNAIGNLASQNQFYFMAGGVNTFDQAFCDKIGGYPEGAVLKYLNNGYLYDVISLVDNNTMNFVTNGVDGVNWKYLSVTEKLVFDDVFFEGGSGVSVGSALLGIVKAKKSGGIVLSTSLSPVVGELKSEFPYGGSDGFYTTFGCGVMIKDLGNSSFDNIELPTIVSSNATPSADWKGWKSLSGDFTMMVGNYQTTEFRYFEQSTAGLFSTIEAGNNYAIALMCGLGDWSNDGLNSKIICGVYQSIEGSLKIMYA